MNDREAVDAINKALDDQHPSNFARLCKIANIVGQNEAWREGVSE